MGARGWAARLCAVLGVTTMVACTCSTGPTPSTEPPVVTIRPGVTTTVDLGGGADLIIPSGAMTADATVRANHTGSPADQWTDMKSAGAPVQLIADPPNAMHGMLTVEFRFIRRQRESTPRRPTAWRPTIPRRTRGPPLRRVLEHHRVLVAAPGAGGDQRLEGRVQPPPQAFRAGLPDPGRLRCGLHPPITDSHRRWISSRGLATLLSHTPPRCSAGARHERATPDGVVSSR